MSQICLETNDYLPKWKELTGPPLSELSKHELFTFTAASDEVFIMASKT